MLAGATQLPESDGFGPCFRRITKPFRRFELGFELKILAERDRIVRGVVPGSAAERGPEERRCDHRSDRSRWRSREARPRDHVSGAARRPSTSGYIPAARRDGPDVSV